MQLLARTTEAVARKPTLSEREQDWGGVEGGGVDCVVGREEAWERERRIGRGEEVVALEVCRRGVMLWAAGEGVTMQGCGVEVDASAA